MGNLGNCCNFQKRSNLLRRLVEGRGLEPPASSLRTRREAETRQHASGPLSAIIPLFVAFPAIFR